MKRRNLEQVLRVRALMEDQARAELERQAHAVRQIEEAAARQQRAALAIRRQVREQMTKGEQERMWLLDDADAELLERKSGWLRFRAQADKPALERAREAMLERRRERQQMEMLVEAARRADEQERLRKEQQQVDDWFQARTVRGEPHSEAGSRTEN